MNNINLFPGNGKYCGLHNIDFKLNSGDKVLDVGGGNKPFIHANYVCDFIDKKEQRHFQELKIGDRFFLEGDVCEILQHFPDKYFDFIYTNHTLEHIENLPKALELFSQKGKRGFNAFPGSDFEFFTTQKHFGHVNLLRVINQTIHISKRPENSIIQEFGLIYNQLFQTQYFNQLWEEDYRFIWECRHYWENEINFIVHNDTKLLYPQTEFFK